MNNKILKLIKDSSHLSCLYMMRLSQWLQTERLGFAFFVLALVQTLATLSQFLCFKLMLQNVMETSLVAGLFMLICQNY